MFRKTTILLFSLVAGLVIGLWAGCSENPMDPAPGGVVRIRLEPFTLQADWSVTGPDNFQASGTGDLRITGRRGGTYSVTWRDLAGWITPPEETLTMAEGDSAVFIGDYAGADWHRQVSGTTEALMGVSFTGPDVGTVVGMNGVILRTIDAGVTWTAQDSGTDEDLRAVDFADANTGIAVGTKGTILSTANGGATWVSRDGETDYDLTDVDLASTTLGTVVGMNGTYRRTLDGGGEWTPVHAWESWSWDWSTRTYVVTYYHRSDDEMYGVSHGTNNAIVAVGARGLIMRSADMGRFWNADSTSTSIQPLVDVVSLDRETSFAVGAEGTILRSTDRGASWASLDGGTNQYLYAVDFADHDTGFVVGLHGTILRTIDGGDTWTSQVSGTFRFLMAVDVVDATTAVAVGEDGIIIRTTSGGGVAQPSESGSTH